MPAFDVYHSVGPNVDVHLFGEAAEVGAKLGQEIPNPVTSAISGAEQGYKYGTDIAVEQAHTAQIQSETDAQNQQNQLRAMQFQTAQLNQQAQQDLVTTDTQNKLAAAKEAAQDASNTQKINQALSSGDTNTLSQIFSDPGVIGTLERNKDLGDEVSRTIQDSPNVDPKAKAQAQAFRDLTKESEYMRATADILQAQRKGLDEKYPDNLAKASSVIAGATGATNNSIIPESELNQYSTAPSNYWQLNTKPDGTQYINRSAQPNTNAQVEIPGLKLTNPYALFKGDQKVGNLDESQFKAFNQAKQELIARRQLYGLSTVQPQQQQQQTSQPNATPTPVAVPTFGGQTAPAGPGSVPPPPPGVSEDAYKQRYNQQVQARAQAADEKSKAVPIAPGNSFLSNLKTRQQAINSGTQIPSTAATQVPIPSTSATLDRTSYSPDEAISRVAGSDISMIPTPSKKIDSDIVETTKANPYLDRAPPLLRGLAAVESGGGRSLTSPTGVKGILQVTKSAAAQVSKNYGISLNRDKPEDNVLAGSLYLADLLYKFNGNLRLALTGYSAAGPGGVSDAIREAGTTEWEPVKAKLKENLSPAKFKQAENYADNVLSYATQFLGNNPAQDQQFLYQLQQNGLIVPRRDTSA